MDVPKASAVTPVAKGGLGNAQVVAAASLWIKGREQVMRRITIIDLFFK